MFAGYGYSKKTLAAQSIEVSCAAGCSVFGVYRAETCRVLHLDYEQGRRLTFERYQRLARAAGVDGRSLGDRLRVAVFPSLYLDSLGAEDVFARVFEGYGLVVIDSLRASAPSADENSSDVRRLIDILNRASDKTGATPILLHHARKPNDQTKGGARMSIRGSSAIFDAVQSMFVFEGEKGQPTVVHHEKERLTGVELPDFDLA